MEGLDFSFHLNELAFIRFLILGIVFFLFFRFLGRVSRKAVMRSSYRVWLRRLIPPIEGITWFVFFMLALNSLSSTSIWGSVIIISICLIAVIWISWYGIRDIIAGIILKTEGAIVINDRIQLKEVTGQIKKMGYRIMELETDTGEIVNLPYSRVSGSMQIKSNPGEKMKSHRFEVEISPESNLAMNDMVNKVKQVAYNAPWSSLKKAPQVKLLLKEDGHKYMEVIIYALKVEYFSLIKNYLTSYLPEVNIR